MPPVPPKKKTTPAQRFAKIHALWIDKGATKGDRNSALHQMQNWLKHHKKTLADIPEILEQARADDDAAGAPPPPPPPDPRAGTPHPYSRRKFSPADVVEHVIRRYVWMPEHVAVIGTLWTIFTHVYPRYAIAPRLALTSEGPNSGKSTLRKVLSHFVYRPNAAAFSTGAALTRHIARGPCTVLLDELDLVSADAKLPLLRIWNLGHERGEKEALMDKGKEREFDIHAPMLAAGLGSFMKEAQLSRTYPLDMMPYTAETKPERDYRVNPDLGEFAAVYSFLDEWVMRTELNPDPPMPPGLITRYADNARGLLAVADACGSPWPQRGRAAVMLLYEKEMAERPKITILRHGLAICDALGLDRILSDQLDRELKKLDAMWNRYRGPSGTDLGHPIEPYERSALLRSVDVEVGQGRTPEGRNLRGYKRAQFEEALRRHASGGTGSECPYPRLITPSSK
jgi:hypothetical protein